MTGGQRWQPPEPALVLVLTLAQRSRAARPAFAARALVPRFVDRASLAWLTRARW